MATKSVLKKPAVEKEFRINEQKWTKPLMDAGWTAIPTIIVERQRALQLDSLDVNILLHLASYWWTADNKPHPSKKTLAEAMGVNSRTIQRHIAEMEKDGIISREQRRIKGQGSKTNKYHFDGLIEAALPFAKEKLKERKKREDEAKRKASRKRPRLEVVE